MNTIPRKLITVTTAIMMGLTSAFAAVKNGASLKGNEYTKGGNNAKGGGVIAWNSYSSVDPTTFNHDLTSGDLTVLKDGDYLVAFTVPFNTINAQRNTHRAELLVNGEAITTALGESGYLRFSNAHTEASDHFAGLISGLKANDIITLKTTPVAAVALESFIETANLYVELLEADRNVFSATATAIQSGTNLNMAPDTGDQNLVWTSERKGSGYSHSNGDPGVTIKDGGNYIVYVNVPLNGDIARGSVGLTVTLDDDYVEGARGQQGYIRNSNAHKNSSIHFSGVISAEAGQVLAVYTEQLALAGTVKVQPNRAASIYIEKLEDDGLYVDSFTGTTAGENLNPDNKFALSLVGDGISPDLIDDASYSNEGDNEENIVIKKAGSYLLSFNSTFTGGNSRANPRVTVEINGSVVPGATSTAHYNRHSDGHDETTGSFVALLNDLAVDDVVTISVQREANGGVVTSPEGGKVSLQAKDAYKSAAGDSNPPKIAYFTALGLDGFEARIEDFGLSVNAASIKVTVDGAEAAFTTSKSEGVTIVNYAFATIPTPKSVHPVKLTYSDSGGNSHSHALSVAITVDYKGIPASFAATSVDKSARGFVANVSQVSIIQTETAQFIHGGSIAGAEKQLRGEYLNPDDLDDNDNPRPYLNEADPEAWEGWSIAPVDVDGTINWNQDEGAAIGNFGEDQPIPQIPGWGDSSDGVAAEMLAYLELSKGLHTLGVNSDDGFKLSFGPNAKDLLGVNAGQFDGGRGSADSIFNIVAEADGLYPVRLLWYENGGGANVEFFSVADGKKILINSDNANAIKAYRSGDTAPYISRVFPLQGDLSQTIEFDFTNADLSVDKASIKLKLNGQDVASSSSSTEDGVAVVYNHGAYLPAGNHTVELSYTESGGTSRVREYSFSIPKGRIDILEDKPVIYIPFDDTSGENAVASVGTPTPQLVYGNGPELGVPALYPNGVGTAVRFDGSKDQDLKFNDSPLVNTGGTWPRGALTWEFWFKPEKLPTTGQINTLWEQGGVTRGIHFYLNGTQDSDATEAEIYMMAWNRGETLWGGALNQVGSDNITAVKSTVKLGHVYHLTFVLVGDESGDLEGTLTGYLNGRSIGTVSGVHMLHSHGDDSAFANMWTNAVDHNGDLNGTGGLGFTGVIDDAVFYHKSLTAEQVASNFEGGFAQKAIEITTQPQDSSTPEGSTATFSVKLTGTPLVDVKWLVNGEEAATDAVISDSTLSIVATEANNGAKIKAELTNKSGSVTTAEVILTTVVDKAAPEVASIVAYAGTINQVAISFNEPLDPASAETVANYTIEGLTVNSAVLGADGKKVTLSTSQQASGSYTVAISGVKDLSARANTVNTSASFESSLSYAQEVMSDGPIIYWKLGETAGTVANDEMGNRTGIYVSASGSGLPTLNADSLVPASNDGAVHFDAAKDQKINIADHKLMNTGTFKEKTLEFWFKADSLPQSKTDVPYQQKVVIWEQGGGWKGLRFYLTATDDSDTPSKADLYFMANSHIGGGTTSDPAAWTSPPLNLKWGGSTDERGPASHFGYEDSVPVFVKSAIQVNKIYHVVGIIEGDSEGLDGKLKLYVNGKLADEAGGVSQMYSHGNDAGIGGINAGTIFHDEIADGDLLEGDLHHFTGTVDEIAQYNLVLTADQIAGRYEVGNTSAPAPDAPSTILIDFAGTGANSAGASPDPWISINNLVMDEAVDLGGGVTITALDDGFNPNNPAQPGEGAEYDGVSVPQEARNDYFFKIADAAGTTARMRIDGLAAGTYNVTVFEGRTTDASQFAKIWTGEEPAAENTGDFAKGSATVTVTVAAGEPLWYMHLEDGSGGVSGMMIRQAADTPELSIVNNGDGTVTVTYEGRLQAATSVNGPWADVEGATSPQIIPSNQAMQFGRAVK